MKTKRKQSIKRGRRKEAVDEKSTLLLHLRFDEILTFDGDSDGDYRRSLEEPQGTHSTPRSIRVVHKGFIAPSARKWTEYGVGPKPIATREHRNRRAPSPDFLAPALMPYGGSVTMTSNMPEKESSSTGESSSGTVGEAWTHGRTADQLHSRMNCCLNSTETATQQMKESCPYRCCVCCSCCCYCFRCCCCCCCSVVKPHQHLCHPSHQHP